MNKEFQKINEEDILFIDCEVVRKNKELVKDSKEWELFRWKTRNRDTDEFLSDEDLIKEYESRGALKMCYNKIVSIGLGFIKNGKSYISSIDGEEKEIIDEFTKIISNFKFVCGFNILEFDMPLLLNNGWRYFNMTEKINDAFITNGKKPWNLGAVLDLMDVFKGTHYYRNSLDEVCYHFDIDSPKDDISGADVSRVYYSEGVTRISKYVKKDVFATIQLFRKMQGKALFDGFTDRTIAKEDVEFKGNVFQKIMNIGSLTDDVRNELAIKIGSLDKKEKEIAKVLVEAHLQQPKSSKADIENVKQEVDELFKKL